MKLYPLLFLNEAQVFARHAYKLGLVIVRIGELGPEGAAFYLINKNNIKDENGELKKNGQGIVYGSLDVYPGDNRKLMQVRSSDAISGYGPLLYQTAMFAIKPKWLQSDTSLTSDSYEVWNKMYQFSEKGVYERMYVGNLDKISRSECANALGQKPDNKESKTEQAFLNFLQTLTPPVKPENVGCYWAYRKLDHEPEISLMLKEGEKLLAQDLGGDRDIVFDWVGTANLQGEK